jgi:hypothetical protein
MLGLGIGPSGPLHTRAKGRDHEIVRAQKEVLKSRPKTPPKSCSVVMHPQVYYEVTCEQTLNQMLFQRFFFIHVRPLT